MCDLISRQAAIEIIQSMYPGIPRIPWMRKDWQERYAPFIRTENAIRELSSAHPETCAYWDGESNICALHRPSAQPEDWMERNKERILQAGMEGREIEFRIGGRLFAIREKAQ